MENATQALMIAAGVLIGLIILSLGVYLAYTMGDYAANTQSEMEKNTIAQFNAEFMKYNGLTDLTIQDVITVKNYALEHNRKYGDYNPFSEQCRAKPNNEYIDVYYSKTKSQSFTALVLDNSDEKLLEDEIKEINNGKEPNRFSCDVQINSKTGKVNRIFFYETRR